MGDKRLHGRWGKNFTFKTVSSSAATTPVLNPGALVLIATEVWERFSFYGMRVLLIFFLIDRFGESRAEALVAFGTYSALAFVSPLLGGVVGSWFLSRKEAVLLGATVLTVGHCSFLVEPLFGGSGGTLDAAYFALATIIVGVGLLKPNLTALLGAQYGDAARRDAAFVYYSGGISLGSLGATLVCGYLGQRWGWNWGLGAAGIGMTIGLAIFVAGRHLVAEPIDRDRAGGGTVPTWAVVAACLATIAPFWMLVRSATSVGALLVVLVPLATGLLVALGYRDRRAARPAAFGLVALFAATIVFWTCYEQMSSSLLILAQDHVDLRLFGLPLVPTQVKAFNPLFVVVTAPMIAALWLQLERHGRIVPTTVRYAIGAAIIGGGFLLLASLAVFATPIPLAAVALTYLLVSLSGHFVEPATFAAISRHAPADLAAGFVAVYYLFYASAQFLAGLLAAYLIGNAGGELSDYARAFLRIAALLLGLSLACVAARRPVARLLATGTAVA